MLFLGDKFTLTKHWKSAECELFSARVVFFSFSPREHNYRNEDKEKEERNF
jgi:hypothetical protein